MTSLKTPRNYTPQTNEELELHLKHLVAYLVFFMLIFETLALFALLFFQGFSWQGFSIADATLNIFLPVTIVQISAMAIIITKYLFPEKK